MRVGGSSSLKLRLQQAQQTYSRSQRIQSDLQKKYSDTLNSIAQNIKG